MMRQNQEQCPSFIPVAGATLSFVAFVAGLCLALNASDDTSSRQFIGNVAISAMGALGLMCSGKKLYDVRRRAASESSRPLTQTPPYASCGPKSPCQYHTLTAPFIKGGASLSSGANPNNHPKQGDPKAPAPSFR